MNKPKSWSWEEDSTADVLSISDSECANTHHGSTSALQGQTNLITGHLGECLMVEQVLTMTHSFKWSFCLVPVSQHQCSSQKRKKNIASVNERCIYRSFSTQGSKCGDWYNICTFISLQSWVDSSELVELDQVVVNKPKSWSWEEDSTADFLSISDSECAHVHHGSTSALQGKTNL